MSGHNRWTKIKRKKEAMGATKGALFTKLIREVTVAARTGGGDPDHNARLRSAVLAAREANMPNDTITRAIKKGTGELEGVNYEELTYEGYGPGGVAFVLEILTDNKNRTAGPAATRAGFPGACGRRFFRCVGVSLASGGNAGAPCGDAAPARPRAGGRRAPALPPGATGRRSC